MAVADELIRVESNGKLSFGNFKLEEKSKVSDFIFNGDTYKVKTFKEITKLEKNEAFLYESVPGTNVTDFEETEGGVTFTVDCESDASITLGLEQDAIYRVMINDESAGTMETGVGGKISFNVTDLPGGSVYVMVVKI